MKAMVGEYERGLWYGGWKSRIAALLVGLLLLVAYGVSAEEEPGIPEIIGSSSFTYQVCLPTSWPDSFGFFSAQTASSEFWLDGGNNVDIQYGDLTWNIMPVDGGPAFKMATKEGNPRGGYISEVDGVDYTAGGPYQYTITCIWGEQSYTKDLEITLIDEAIPTGCELTIAKVDTDLQPYTVGTASTIQNQLMEMTSGETYVVTGHFTGDYGEAFKDCRLTGWKMEACDTYAPWDQKFWDEDGNWLIDQSQRIHTATGTGTYECFYLFVADGTNVVCYLPFTLQINEEKAEPQEIEFAQYTLYHLNRLEEGLVYLPTEGLDGNMMLTGIHTEDWSMTSDVTDAGIEWISGDENLKNLLVVRYSYGQYYLYFNTYDGVGTATFRVSATSESGIATKDVTVTVAELPEGTAPKQMKDSIQVSLNEPVDLSSMGIIANPGNYAEEYYIRDGDGSSFGKHEYIDEDGKRFSLKADGSFEAWESGTYRGYMNVRPSVNLIQYFNFTIEVLDSGSGDDEKPDDGNEMRWEFSGMDWDGSHGVLYLSGNGWIPDYENFSEAPWSNYAEEIDQIIIGKGISSIGANAFAGLPNLIRVDFNEDTAPAIHAEAFTNTDAFYRYYSYTEGWPTGERWIYLPLDNQDAYENQSLSYSQDLGWYMTVGETNVSLSAAQAKEETYRLRHISLHDIPLEEDFNSICNDWGATRSITFEEECSGEVNINIPAIENFKPSISSCSDNVTLSIRSESKMTFLNVGAGNVMCTADMEYLTLRTRPENHGAMVIVEGIIDKLNLQTGDQWDAYTGSLMLKGSIISGTTYANAMLAIPNVSEPVPFENVAVMDLQINTGADYKAVIENGVVNTDLNVADPMELYDFYYEFRDDQWGVGLTPKEGHSDLPMPAAIPIAPYKVDFSAEDIAYGEHTLVILHQTDENVILSGQVRELMVLGASVTTNGPVWSIYPDGIYHITINDTVNYLYVTGENVESTIELGANGYVDTGYRNRRLRSTAYFDNVSGACTLYSDGKLQILSRIDGQSISSILPSDQEVTDAAGEKAMIDMVELSNDDLSKEEWDAIEGTMISEDDTITNLVDLVIMTYGEVDDGEIYTIGTLSELSESVDIALSGQEGDYIIRLHEKDGKIQSDRIPGTYEHGAIRFKSHWFSKYLVVHGDEEELDISALTTLVLPKELVRIENQAFENGTFQAVIIPDGCNYIGSEAFKNCKDLVYVSYPATAEIGENAFEGCNIRKMDVR